jgi:hypothetical protein
MYFILGFLMIESPTNKYNKSLMYRLGMKVSPFKKWYKEFKNSKQNNKLFYSKRG